MEVNANLHAVILPTWKHITELYKILNIKTFK